VVTFVLPCKRLEYYFAKKIKYHQMVFKTSSGDTFCVSRGNALLFYSGFAERLVCFWAGGCGGFGRVLLALAAWVPVLGSLGCACSL
jgi:hypothetical protein